MTALGGGAPSATINDAQRQTRRLTQNGLY